LVAALDVELGDDAKEGPSTVRTETDRRSVISRFGNQTATIAALSRHQARRRMLVRLRHAKADPLDKTGSSIQRRFADAEAASPFAASVIRDKLR
jgi:hypothetical protein